MAPRKKAEKETLTQEEMEQLSVEDAFKYVDKIISALQDDNISLEDSFKEYSRGMELLRHAGSRIDMIEKDALVISSRGTLEPLDDTQS
jgi:exodeoxyribonuclease VII small subunit